MVGAQIITRLFCTDNTCRHVLTVSCGAVCKGTAGRSSGPGTVSVECHTMPSCSNRYFHRLLSAQALPWSQASAGHCNSSTGLVSARVSCVTFRGRGDITPLAL